MKLYKICKLVVDDLESYLQNKKVDHDWDFYLFLYYCFALPPFSITTLLVWLSFANINEAVRMTLLSVVIACAIPIVSVILLMVVLLPVMLFCDCILPYWKTLERRLRKIEMDKPIPPITLIANECHHDIVQLHTSDAWKKAPWRRKLKLAYKEWQRIQERYGLSYSKIIWSQHGAALVSQKKRIVNHLLEPLRFCTHSVWDDIGTLLLYPIPNKQGAYLTKLAKKKNKFFHLGDLHPLRRHGFTLADIPFRHPWENVEYHDFWKGAAHARACSAWKKSDKTLKEIASK